MSPYAHPDVLVDAQWVAEHHLDPNVRLVEVNEDPNLYATGHIPQAAHWHPDWRDYLSHDYLIGNRMAFLASRMLGAQKDTILVFYGADHNWWAGFAFWLFKRFGHPDCRILNGGREAWSAAGYSFSIDLPRFPVTTYDIAESRPDDRDFRTTAEQVKAQLRAGRPVIDVRSADEYSGQVVFVPSAFRDMFYPRPGHIPGAVNVNWKRTLQPDGTFKSPEELRALYTEAGVDLTQTIITYCSVGERSGHTWFVLKYLLGLLNVLNYDGSWVEWGSRPELPRAIGSEPGLWTDSPA